MADPWPPSGLGVVEREEEEARRYQFSDSSSSFSAPHEEEAHHEENSSDPGQPSSVPSPDGVYASYHSVVTTEPSGSMSAVANSSLPPTVSDPAAITATSAESKRRLERWSDGNTSNTVSPPGSAPVSLPFPLRGVGPAFSVTVPYTDYALATTAVHQCATASDATGDATTTSTAKRTPGPPPSPLYTGALQGVRQKRSSNLSDAVQKQQHQLQPSPSPQHHQRLLNRLARYKASPSSPSNSAASSAPLAERKPRLNQFRSPSVGRSVGVAASLQQQQRPRAPSWSGHGSGRSQSRARHASASPDIPHLASSSLSSPHRPTAVDATGVHRLLDPLEESIRAAAELVFAQMRMIALAESNALTDVADGAVAEAAAVPLPVGSSALARRALHQRELTALVSELEQREACLASRCSVFIQRANVLALELVNAGQFTLALAVFQRTEAYLSKGAGCRVPYLRTAQDLATSPVTASSSPKAAQHEAHPARPADEDTSAADRLLPTAEMHVPFFAPAYEQERLRAVAAVQNNYGLYHFKLREYELARKRLTRAVLLEEALEVDTVGITYYNLAQVKWELGDLASACSSLTLAAEAVERRMHRSKDEMSALRRRIGRSRHLRRQLLDTAEPDEDAETVQPLTEEAAANKEERHFLSVWLRWREDVCLLSQIKGQMGQWLESQELLEEAVQQYEQSYLWLRAVPRRSRAEGDRLRALEQRKRQCKRLLQRRQVEEAVLHRPVSHRLRKRAARGGRRAPRSTDGDPSQLTTSVVVTTVLPRHVELQDSALAGRARSPFSGQSGSGVRQTSASRLRPSPSHSLPLAYSGVSGGARRASSGRKAAASVPMAPRTTTTTTTATTSASAMIAETLADACGQPLSAPDGDDDAFAPLLALRHRPPWDPTTQIPTRPPVTALDERVFAPSPSSHSPFSRSPTPHSPSASRGRGGPARADSSGGPRSSTHVSGGLHSAGLSHASSTTSSFLRLAERFSFPEHHGTAALIDHADLGSGADGWAHGEEEGVVTSAALVARARRICAALMPTGTSVPTVTKQTEENEEKGEQPGKAARFPQRLLASLTRDARTTLTQCITTVQAFTRATQSSRVAVRRRHHSDRRRHPFGTFQGVVEEVAVHAGDGPTSTESRTQRRSLHEENAMSAAAQAGRSPTGEAEGEDGEETSDAPEPDPHAATTRCLNDTMDEADMTAPPSEHVRSAHSVSVEPHPDDSTVEAKTEGGASSPGAARKGAAEETALEAPFAVREKNEDVDHVRADHPDTAERSGEGVSTQRPEGEAAFVNTAAHVTPLGVPDALAGSTSSEPHVGEASSPAKELQETRLVVPTTGATSSHDRAEATSGTPSPSITVSSETKESTRTSGSPGLPHVNAENDEAREPQHTGERDHASDTGGAKRPPMASHATTSSEPGGGSPGELAVHTVPPPPSLPPTTADAEAVAVTSHTSAGTAATALTGATPSSVTTPPVPLALRFSSSSSTTVRSSQAPPVLLYPPPRPSSSSSRDNTSGVEPCVERRTLRPTHLSESLPSSTKGTPQGGSDTSSPPQSPPDGVRVARPQKYKKLRDPVKTTPLRRPPSNSGSCCTPTPARPPEVRSGSGSCSGGNAKHTAERESAEYAERNASTDHRQPSLPNPPRLPSAMDAAKAPPPQPPVPAPASKWSAFYLSHSGNEGGGVSSVVEHRRAYSIGDEEEQDVCPPHGTAPEENTTAAHANLSGVQIVVRHSEYAAPLAACIVQPDHVDDAVGAGDAINLQSPLWGSPVVAEAGTSKDGSFSSFEDERAKDWVEYVAEPVVQDTVFVNLENQGAFGFSGFQTNPASGATFPASGLSHAPLPPQPQPAPRVPLRPPLATRLSYRSTPLTAGTSGGGGGDPHASVDALTQARPVPVMSATSQSSRWDASSAIGADHPASAGVYAIERGALSGSHQLPDTPANGHTTVTREARPPSITSLHSSSPRDDGWRQSASQSSSPQHETEAHTDSDEAARFRESLLYMQQAWFHRLQLPREDPRPPSSQSSSPPQ